MELIQKKNSQAKTFGQHCSNSTWRNKCYGNKETYPAESDAYVTDLPSHQAPIHRGSVGVILGSIERSA